MLTLTTQPASHGDSSAQALKGRTTLAAPRQNTFHTVSIMTTICTHSRVVQRHFCASGKDAKENDKATGSSLANDTTPQPAFLNARRPLQECLCEISLPCYNLHLRVRVRACAVTTEA